MMKTRSGLLPFCSAAKDSSSSSSSLLGCQNRSPKNYPHLVIRSSNNSRQTEGRLLMESGVSVACADAGTAATTTGAILSRIGRRKRCSSSSSPTPTLSSSSFSVIAHLYTYLPLICLLTFISFSSSSTILAANAAAPPSRTLRAISSPTTSTPTPPPPTSCIIGRLRECLDDEDCFEDALPAEVAGRPQVRVIVSSAAKAADGTAVVDQQVVHSHTFLSKQATTSSSSSAEDLPEVNNQRMGTCTCRQASKDCARTRREQQARASSSSSSSSSDQRSANDSSSNRSGGSPPHRRYFLSCLVLILFGGSSIFAVYFYGFRHGLLHRIARRLGLTDRTQVEHQLLNRISSSNGNGSPETQAEDEGAAADSSSAVIIA